MGGDGGRAAPGLGARLVGQAAQQGGGDLRQQGGGGLVILRQRQTQHQRQAARGGRGGFRGAGEGEKLQQVQRILEGRQVQPARGGRGMDQQGGRFFRQEDGGLACRHHPHLPICRQHGGAAEASDQGGRIRQ